MKAIIILGLICLISSIKIHWGKNEQYNSCGSVFSLIISEYLHDRWNKCYSGCHSDKGYVPSEKGASVREEERISRDEYFYENQLDDSKTFCPLTCGNYLHPPVMCKKKCNPRYHCEKGYLLSGKIICDTPKEWPVTTEQCGKHEPYESFDTYCFLTRDNYLHPSLMCHSVCNSGCHSNNEDVRSDDVGSVRPEEFPVRAEHRRPRKSSANICQLEFETGHCREYIPFDKKTGQCKEFVYEGCGGNENNIETKETCNQTCG